MNRCIITIAIILLNLIPVCFGDEDIGEGKIDQLNVEELGVPVRTMRRGQEFLVPKPEGGWWLITSYHPISRSPLPLQAFIIDLDTGEVEMTRREPPGALYQGLMGLDGKFYMGHYAKMGMWRFDPADGALEWRDFPEMQQRILPFRMQMASDGRIYMGTASAVAHVVEYDPVTGKFRDFGVQGPAHGAPRYIYYMAVGDKHVYSAAGKNPWYLVAADRETMEQKTLIERMEYINVSGSGEHCYATVTLPPLEDGPAVREYYHLVDGRAVKIDAIPPRHRPVADTVAAAPELLMTMAGPDSEGRGIIWWRPQDGEWKSVELTGIQTEPWGFHSLIEMADGRILGAPGAYEYFFIYDPAKNEFETVGKSPLSCYRMERAGDNIYLMGYPGTYMVEYDPARPWTYFTSTPEKKEPPLTDPESNPRECHRWSVGIMPTHHVRGSAVGADGCIYMGAHAERAAVGGGLGWWDPKERKPYGIREPFVMQDCTDMTSVKDGRIIVYSSRPVSDPAGNLPKPDEARLFLLDTRDKSLSEVVPIPEIDDCGPVAGLGNLVFGVGRIGEKHALYVVDVDARTTVFTREMPERATSNLAVGPDGNIYFFIGGTLQRLKPQGRELQPLGIVEKPGRILFVGDDIYLTGSPELRRIRNVTGL